MLHSDHMSVVVCCLWKLSSSSQAGTFNYSCHVHTFSISEVRGNVNMLFGTHWAPRGGKVLLCAAGKQAWQEAVLKQVSWVQQPCTFLFLLIEGKARPLSRGLPVWACVSNIAVCLWYMNKFHVPRGLKELRLRMDCASNTLFHDEHCPLMRS